MLPRMYEAGVLVWLSPSAVKFDRTDMEYLLPWLEDMRGGQYPTLVITEDTGVRRFGLGKAHFEQACQIAAEIDIRLARTGLEKYMVEQYYQMNSSMDITEDAILDIISAGIHKDRAWVKKRIGLAVGYISSGECQRWVNCIDCHSYAKCNKKIKGRVGKTYEEWIQSRSSSYEKMEVR